jgi:hypothetical protein
MSFKEEVDDAKTHVVAIRLLIQLSRPPRPGEKLDEDKEKKKMDTLEDTKKNVRYFSQERIDSLTAVSKLSLPMEVDEIIHKLERMEFLIEDEGKGKDRKSNLRNLIESFKTVPAVQGSLLAIPTLQRITSES